MKSTLLIISLSMPLWAVASLTPLEHRYSGEITNRKTQKESATTQFEPPQCTFQTTVSCRPNSEEIQSELSLNLTIDRCGNFSLMADLSYSEPGWTGYYSRHYESLLSLQEISKPSPRRGFLNSQTLAELDSNQPYINLSFTEYTYPYQDLLKLKTEKKTDLAAEPPHGGSTEFTAQLVVQKYSQTVTTLVHCSSKTTEKEL
jgi:hypothetical protein